MACGGHKYPSESLLRACKLSLPYACTAVEAVRPSVLEEVKGLRRRREKCQHCVQALRSLFSSCSLPLPKLLTGLGKR
mgnify:CR=1 FL=1